MRDLEAEQAGDINRGQTHRLNRIAAGRVSQAPPPPSYHRQPLRTSHAPVISPSVPRFGGPIPGASLPAATGRGGNINVALEMAASFGKAKPSKRRAKLPKRLPAPPIPLPHGARQVKRSQPFAPKPTQHLMPKPGQPLKPTQPFIPKLVDDASFLKSNPMLAASKWAPVSTPKPATTTTKKTPSPPDPVASVAPVAPAARVAPVAPVVPVASAAEQAVIQGMMEGWIELIYVAKQSAEPTIRPKISSREGISEDGTVCGGPFFMAAVLASLPYLGRMDLVEML